MSLPVTGQGVFVFEQKGNDSSALFSIKDIKQEQGIQIEFTKQHVLVTNKETSYVDPNNTSGLSPHQGAYYWFSLDSHNQRLYAGVGEPRMETAIYTYVFTSKDKQEHDSIKLFLESLSTVYYTESIKLIRIIRDPIKRKIALGVKDISELTMDHIASNSYMPIANLSPICQKLFYCIAGEKFVLDTPDFPDFTQAIEYSIRTPGMWCYQKLLDKSTEFNPDKPNIKETYLRITLNENNGESPGIPYVMEIWPVGHYSPIHSHANGNAIVRVLNGEINVTLFPFLCPDGVPPFGSATFKKDEITWITPTLNQTHQLKNMEKNTYTCITIQCYMYSSTSNNHYDYFDYIDDSGKKQQYDPDSDMDFLEFKKTIRKEWMQQKSKRGFFCGGSLFQCLL